MVRLLLLIFAFTVTSYAENVPIKATRASATLPPQSGVNFSTRNLIDKLSSTSWAAPFHNKSITVELKVDAFEVNKLRILNGDNLDKHAYDRSSRAKKIKIFVNNKDNLVQSETLKNSTWKENGNYDEISFSPALQDVKILIIQIESVYPGIIKDELMISEIAVEGLVSNPLKQDYTPEFMTLTDARDGQEYKTLKIGNRHWMAENLAYADEGSSCVEITVGVRCSEKGRYYSEFSADDGLCPLGWRLPTREDFMELNQFVKDMALDTAGIFQELFISSESANRFGLGLYGSDSLFNSSPMETAFWVQRFKIEDFEGDVPFVRVDATRGAYAPDAEIMSHFRNIDIKQRTSFFVRCVEE